MVPPYEFPGELPPRWLSGGLLGLGILSLAAVLGASRFGPILHPISVAAETPDSDEGWTTIRPGGDTGCAFGEPFRFFHRESSDPTGLMVYFQGGGACWDWVSCSGMFDTTVDERELDGYGGIFDLSNPDNPFAGYAVVFVPYCTGDVHIGDAVRRYGDDTWEAPTVAHHGARNVGAVLAWMKSHLARERQPELLVVTGASAGSYGALFHAPAVAEIFPAARLVMIGDSGVPLLHAYPAILEGWGGARVLRERWGVHGNGERRSPVTLESAHLHLSRLRPDATMAQISTDQDAVQAAFYLYSGSPNWRRATLDLLAALEDQIPRFSAFVLSGGEHGLLRSDRLYSFREGGVLLTDWITRLVAGEPVNSVYCTSCVPASRRDNGRDITGEGGGHAWPTR